MKERLIGCVALALACSSTTPNGGAGPSTTFPDGSVDPTTTCVGEGGLAPVARPVFVRNMKGDKSWAETGWFSSPGLVDLNGDGKKEIVAPFYSFTSPYRDRAATATALACPQRRRWRISTATALWRSCF